MQACQLVTQLVAGFYSHRIPYTEQSANRNLSVPTVNCVISKRRLIPLGELMSDHEKMKERIESTKSFREMVSLRDQVWALSGKVGFSEFVELRDKVERRLAEFDNPIYDDLTILVKIKNGEIKIIKSPEIADILGKGAKISEHIFSNFPGASDFELHYESDEEVSRQLLDDEEAVRLSSNLTGDVSAIKERVRRIVSLALRLVINLFNTYARALPHLAEDLKGIREKLELLLENLNSAYY